MAANPPPLPQHQGRLLAEAGSAAPLAATPHPAETPGLPPAPIPPTAPFKLAHPHTASCARLLQTADIPPDSSPCDTATPAQPDPQTIHLNAAQKQPPQEQLLPKPAHALPPPQEAAVPGASLPTPRVAANPPPLPQHQGRLLAQGVRPPLLPRHILLKPLDFLQLQSHLRHHPNWLTLTRLAVLGCFRQQIFLPRQLAL